jgi:DNA-binding winged helix-turn-helix (wHTH) protein
VRLEPKIMAVLLCLTSRPGEVVTRRAIIDRVWATEFISDSTLTHAIATLRRVLGDDAACPRFIETIPKRGYRLVAEVATDRHAHPGPAPADGPAGPLAVISGNQMHVAGVIDTAPTVGLLLYADREIPLNFPMVVFGRSPEAGIQILSAEVSRRHARLELDGGGAAITDLGSKNGTEVNDRTIDGRSDLCSGDVIGIGPASFIFRLMASEPTRTRDDSP